MISLPSMVIAWLKLRQRNLGPILDANGWAVNAKAKINIPFGKALTGIAVLPPGSKRDLIDPYAEKRGHWYLIAAVAVLIAAALGLWYFGVAERILPGVLPQSPYMKAQKEKAAVPLGTCRHGHCRHWALPSPGLPHRRPVADSAASVSVPSATACLSSRD